MRLRTAPFIATLALLLASATVINSQESSYLSQKLLLENTYQQRITNAISKILDESQFVVDVSIELITTAASQPQMATRTPEGAVASGAQADAAAPATQGQAPTGTVTNPFPIPGFPDVETPITDPLRALDQPAAEATPAPTTPATAAPATIEDVNRIIDSSGDLPIRSMDVSIILEDGVSPQIIENVRQVTLVASRFDRERGDALSITTASFRDSRPSADLASAEIISQTQRDQTQELETRLAEAQDRVDELMQELRNRELEYLERSEEERKQALSDLATVQNERAKDLIFIQQQREESNTRLQEALLNQIDAMREDLTSGQLPAEEQDIISMQTASLEDSLASMRMAFETEKERLEEQIQAALATREEPPQALGGIGDNSLLLLGIALVVILIIAFVILASVRGRAQAIPARMMYPGTRPYPRPRPPARSAQAPPRKKKKPRPEKPAEEPKPKKAPAEPEKEPAAKEAPPAEPEVEVAAKPAEPTPSHVEDDPEVQRSELKSIRQSVVSMSVGRPESATRILSNWLQEEQEPSETAVDESAESAADEAAEEES